MTASTRIPATRAAGVGRHPATQRVPVADHLVHANGASIYIDSLRNPYKYITEKGVPRRPTSFSAPLPQKTTGAVRSAYVLLLAHADELSQNQKAAKDRLSWLHTPAKTSIRGSSHRRALFHAADGANGKALSLGPRIHDDPFKVAGKLGQAPGFAGPAGKTAAEVLTQIHHRRYVLRRQSRALFRRGEDSVNWAEGELNKSTLARPRRASGPWAARWAVALPGRIELCVSRGLRRRRCGRWT